MPIEFGLWLDDPWRMIRSDKYWDRMAEHGISTADLMLDTSKVAWDPQFTIPQVEHFCQLAIEQDIEPVALCWPAPRREMIDHMVPFLDEVAEVGVAGIGLDTEHLWRDEYGDGSFPTLRAAGEYLLEDLHRIRDRHDVRIELTTHPGHSEATGRATLTQHVNRFYLQSYSTRHDWRGDDVGWTDRLGPGLRQSHDIARVRRALPCLTNGQVELCLGQALWDQRWPGHLPSEALDAALDVTMAEGIRSVRGWSSKWGIGVKSGSLVQQAVSDWIKRRFG